MANDSKDKSPNLDVVIERLKATQSQFNAGYETQPVVSEHRFSSALEASQSIQLYADTVAKLENIKFTGLQHLLDVRQAYEVIYKSAHNKLYAFNTSSHRHLYSSYKSLLEDLRKLCDDFLYKKENTLYFDEYIAVDEEEFLKGIIERLERGFNKLAADSQKKREILSGITAHFSSSADITGAEAPEEPVVEKYEDRLSRSETAPEFIGRVYGARLDGTFTRADLRKIDAKAEMALRNWERTNGRANLNLPTLKERNDRVLADMKSLPRSSDMRTYDRLKSAKSRRPN